MGKSRRPLDLQNSLHTHSSSAGRINEQIDAFLLSLPLGTSARDAAIEDKVAGRLLLLLEEHMAMQGKLNEWVRTASELRLVTEDQKLEIAALKEGLPPLATPQFSPTRARSLDFEWGYANQQQEIAELKSMIGSLREDLYGNSLAADCHPAYDAVLERLSEAQQQLGELHLAHKMALDNQADLNRKELEAVMIDVQRLECLAEEREEAVQQAYEEQERIRQVHNASEVALHQSTQSKAALQKELQSTQLALAESQAALQNERLASNNGACTANQQAQAAAGDPNAQQETFGLEIRENRHSLSLAVDSSLTESTSLQTPELGRSGVAATDEEEIALRVSSAAWQGALAKEVDRLQEELGQATAAGNRERQALTEQLEASEEKFATRLAAAQLRSSAKNEELASQEAGHMQEMELMRQTAAKDRALLVEQITALEDQLELSGELEGAIAGDLSEASAKLEAQHGEMQEVGDVLAAALQLLRSARVDLRIKREEAAATQAASIQEGMTLAAELHRVRGAAAAEKTKLAAMLREAESRADRLATSLDDAQVRTAELEHKFSEKQAAFAELEAESSKRLQGKELLLTAERETVPDEVDIAREASQHQEAGKSIALGDLASSDQDRPACIKLSDHNEAMDELKLALTEQLIAELDERDDRHEAEIASMQAAFDTRTDVMHKDLKAKLAAIEELEPAWQSAEGRLAEVTEQLERTQNSLADCQEMLEELQEFSASQERDIQELRATLLAGQKAVEGDIEKLEAQCMQSAERIKALEQQVKDLKKQELEQRTKSASLERERDRIRLDLAEALGRLSLLEQLHQGGSAVSSQQVDGEKASGSQLTGLTEALEHNREEYSRRLDLLAGQIADEARRRAEAEAQALNYYRAHTMAQARSQEQNESLLRKIFDQEQAIKRLLSRHPDFTPRSRANMLSALSDASLNKAAPQPGSPQPRELDFGQENVPAATSVGSTSPVRAASAKGPESPARGAFRHLHFNPVFKQDPSQTRLPGDVKRSSRAPPEALSPYNRAGRQNEASPLALRAGFGDSSKWRRDEDAESA